MSVAIQVVSHTHWDREWHLPFEGFRIRLVDLIDRAMELLETDPDFSHFHLDAQTIVLEDYLAIRPRQRERLAGHIRAGRIAVGPWYQLNDLFLTSGESTIRSLLIGHRIAAEFGACGKVGYLPDQFGNLSQMPQILQGFGIDNAILGRGYQLAGDRKAEFVWEAPDGTRVAASLMGWWYNNAQYLPEDPAEALAFVRDLRDRMRSKSDLGALLFMNGVDHLEPLPHIGKTVKEVGSLLQADGDTIRLAALEDFANHLRETLGPALENGSLPQAKPFAVVRGELREDRGGACLAGTLSTRMYLKQANHRARIAMEHRAERLCAFAWAQGQPYPADMLRYSWKLLMQNHPHDSICGCSVDAVHDEMETRFVKVMQVCEELTDRALDALCGRDRTKGARSDWTRLTVWNTTNWERTDPVTATLVFPLGVPRRGSPERDDSLAVKGFVLLDADGREVPFAVLKSETALQTVLSPVELPLDQWVQRVSIEFVAQSVPACGCKSYRIATRSAMPVYPNQTQPFINMLRVQFEDCGEVGDEYLHRKPARDQLFREGLSGMTYSVEANPVRCTLEHDHDWELPASAAADAQSRSQERAVCRIMTRVTKWAGVPRIEFETDFDNRAKDHRLRVVFGQWHSEGRSRAVAEGQFDVIERPMEHPLASEGAAPFHPQQFWSALVYGLPGGGTETLAVINEGLPEYEASPETLPVPGETPHDVLAVTLLRCVGQLSGRGDGPGILTPGAQCLGRHTFRYALLESSGDWQEAQVWKQAHQFNSPLVAVQGPETADMGDRSILSVEPAELVVTSVKQAEDRESVILRFYNTVERAVEGSVRLPGAVRHRLVNLNEEPLGQWQAGESLRLPVTAKRIVTIEFELAER